LFIASASAGLICHIFGGRRNSGSQLGCWLNVGHAHVQIFPNCVVELAAKCIPIFLAEFLGYFRKLGDIK
jgi:hypothetical protein